MTLTIPATLDELAALGAQLAEAHAAVAKIAELDGQIAHAHPAEVKDWPGVGGWEQRRRALGAELERLADERRELAPALQEARRVVAVREREIAEALAALEALRAVSSHPLVTREMTLLDAPGYHEVTRNLEGAAALILRMAAERRARLAELGVEQPDPITITL